MEQSLKYVLAALVVFWLLVAARLAVRIKNQRKPKYYPGKTIAQVRGREK